MFFLSSVRGLSLEGKRTWLSGPEAAHFLQLQCPGLQPNSRGNTCALSRRSLVLEKGRLGPRLYRNKTEGWAQSVVGRQMGRSLALLCPGRRVAAASWGFSPLQQAESYLLCGGSQTQSAGCCLERCSTYLHLSGFFFFF
jgi:hypothetical protein